MTNRFTDEQIEAAARAIYELQPENNIRRYYVGTSLLDYVESTVPFEEAHNKDNAIEKAKAALNAVAELEVDANDGGDIDNAIAYLSDPDLRLSNTSEEPRYDYLKTVLNAARAYLAQQTKVSSGECYGSLNLKEVIANHAEANRRIALYLEDLEEAKNSS